MSRSGPESKTRSTARTGPEWVTFAVSALVLAAVVATLVLLSLQGATPAAPTANEPGPVGASDGQFLVPVDIVNEGDEAAAQVQVIATLSIKGEAVTGDQTIDFLGGGERQRLTFVFTDDPAGGELTISVAGFAQP